MALAASKLALGQAIAQAFIDINKAGAVDGSDPEANIRALGNAISEAIHDYVLTAQVDITTVLTTTTVPPIPAPIPAVHIGFGKLL